MQNVRNLLLFFCVCFMSRLRSGMTLTRLPAPSIVYLRNVQIFFRRMDKTLREIYFKILFVRRSTWIPTSLLVVKISTCDTQRVQSGLMGKKGGLRDWKCHRLIKYISSYMRLTFFAAAFLMTSKSLLQNDSLRRERMRGA